MPRILRPERLPGTDGGRDASHVPHFAAAMSHPVSPATTHPGAIGAPLGSGYRYSWSWRFS
jgi:hypothetical protein